MILFDAPRQDGKLLLLLEIKSMICIPGKAWNLGLIRPKNCICTQCVEEVVTKVLFLLFNSLLTHSPKPVENQIKAVFLIHFRFYLVPSLFKCFFMGK